LSAALAAGLASGKSWSQAVMTAKAFVYGSLCENIKLNDRLSQMYPPVKNYFDQITLDKL
jgi:hydroxymethylpyrimidine/phosphomethylpyrimidine kinase